MFSTSITTILILIIAVSLPKINNLISIRFLHSSPVYLTSTPLKIAQPQGDSQYTEQIANITSIALMLEVFTTRRHFIALERHFSAPDRKHASPPSRVEILIVIQP